MKQPTPPPIALNIDAASAATGLNKKVLVAALASVGVTRFKVPGGQWLYLYTDLERGMAALKSEYHRQASQAADLIKEKNF